VNIIVKNFCCVKNGEVDEQLLTHSKHSSFFVASDPPVYTVQTVCRMQQKEIALVPCSLDFILVLSFEHFPKECVNHMTEI
jgi:hypothetical protein